MSYLIQGLCSNTHQVVLNRFLSSFIVRLVERSSPQSVGDVEGAGIETAVLVAVVVLVGLLVAQLLRTLLARVVRVSVQMGAYVQRLRVKSAFPTTSYLFVDKVSRPRHVQGGPYADRRSVQVAGPYLRHVTTTVHLLVFLPVLVVVVSLECQLGPTYGALETTAVEEREVLERSHSVHLVHGVVTSQASAFVKVHSIHDRSAQLFTPVHSQSLLRGTSGSGHVGAGATSLELPSASPRLSPHLSPTHL